MANGAVRSASDAGRRICTGSLQTVPAEREWLACPRRTREACAHPVGSAATRGARGLTMRGDEKEPRPKTDLRQVPFAQDFVLAWTASTGRAGEPREPSFLVRLGKSPGANLGQASSTVRSNSERLSAAHSSIRRSNCRRLRRVGVGGPTRTNEGRFEEEPEDEVARPRNCRNRQLEKSQSNTGAPTVKFLHRHNSRLHRGLRRVSERRVVQPGRIMQAGACASDGASAFLTVIYIWSPDWCGLAAP